MNKAQVIFRNEDGREIIVHAEAKPDGSFNLTPDYSNMGEEEGGFFIFLHNVFAIGVKTSSTDSPENEEETETIPTTAEEITSESLNSLKGKYLILTKESDDVFEGNHPNGINVGRKLGGYLLNDIQIGEPVFLSNLKPGGPMTSHTSSVIEFDQDKMIIKTENSTYSVEIDETR